MASLNSKFSHILQEKTTFFMKFLLLTFFPIVNIHPCLLYSSSLIVLHSFKSYSMQTYAEFTTWFSNGTRGRGYKGGGVLWIFNCGVMRKYQKYKYKIKIHDERNWVFATNFDFIILIYLQPNVEDLRYFKLWILLDQII